MASRLSVDLILRTALAASDNGETYVAASEHRFSTPYVVRCILDGSPRLVSPNIAEYFRCVELDAEEVDHNLVDEIVRFILTLNGPGDYISYLREVVRVDEPTVDDIGIVASAVKVWMRSRARRGDGRASA